LQASKNEARLAVDLYNRSAQDRSLEAFIVHMSMAWLKLLQARAQRDGDDVYIRDSRGRRQRSRDGDWLLKPLHVMTHEYFSDHDPRRYNLDFFIGLRNKIEHRFEQDLAAVVAGKTQAWLLNFETTLVELFGSGESLGTQLRFPMFISTFTDDAVRSLKAARKRIPKGALDWLQDFDAGLHPAISADQAFDFRVFLVPHTGPKTEADAAMTFVHLRELTEEQLAVMDQAQTVIRDRLVPVADLGALLPSDVSRQVSSALGRQFTTNHHARAWSYFAVRPPAGAPDPTATKSDFCRWNPAFRQYVYTQSWVNFLVRKLESDTDTQSAVFRT